MKRIFCFFLTMFVSSCNWALFCPTNLNQIDFGMTQPEVELQCGKPTQVKSYRAEPDVPQEWTYYQTASANPYVAGQSPFVNSAALPSQANPETQGTLKTNFAFNADGKLINITVGNATITSTNICSNTVSIGMARKEVETACGKAAYVNKGLPTNPSAPPPEMSEWYYNTTPPQTLIFEDGKFTARK